MAFYYCFMFNFMSFCYFVFYYDAVFVWVFFFTIFYNQFCRFYSEFILYLSLIFLFLQIFFLRTRCSILGYHSYYVLCLKSSSTIVLPNSRKEVKPCEA